MGYLSNVIMILVTWLWTYYHLVSIQNTQTDAVGEEDKRDPVSLIDLFAAAYKTERIRVSHKDMIFILKNHRRFTRFLQTLRQIKMICYDEMLGALEIMMPSMPYLVQREILESIVEEVKKNDNARKEYKCFEIITEELIKIQTLYDAIEAIYKNGSKGPNRDRVNRFFTAYNQAFVICNYTENC